MANTTKKLPSRNLIGGRFSNYIYEACNSLDLQMTDVELDERVTALEENAGGEDGIMLRKYISLVSYWFPTSKMHHI